MNRLDQRIAEVELQLSRLKNESSARHRRDETAKKILLGAWLLDWLKKRNTPEALPEGFSEWLTRDRDRRLFNLPPLPPFAKQQQED